MAQDFASGAGAEFSKLLTAALKVKVKSSMARSHPVAPLYYHTMWGQLSTTCSNGTEYLNEELPVAIDHSQLWSSETVDGVRDARSN